MRALARVFHIVPTFHRLARLSVPRVHQAQRWAQAKPRTSIRRLPTPCLQFAQSQINIGGRRRSVTQVARSTVQRPDLVMYRPLQRHRLRRADRPPAGTAFIANLGAALMAGGPIAAAPPASSGPTSLRSPAMTTGSTQWSTAPCSSAYDPQRFSALTCAYLPEPTADPWSAIRLSWHTLRVCVTTGRRAPAPSGRSPSSPAPPAASRTSRTRCPRSGASSDNTPFGGS